MCCYYSFLFKGFFLCWRSATLTILDMKTHFDLDNFNGRPNETISTSNKAGSIEITMLFNVSQSAWFCIAPDCSMWWNIKENFDKCQSQ